MIPSIRSDTLPAHMSKKEKAAASDDEKIIIRLWPKTPLLYPMAFFALVCGIVGQIFGVPEELKGQIEAPVEAVAPAQAVELEESESPTDAKPSPVAPGADDQPIVPPAGTNDAADSAAPASIETPGEGAEEVPAEAGEAVTPMLLEDKVDKSKSGLINTILALAFLGMFAFSLFVVCIDFEVRWSLLGFVLLLMAIMGLLMADRAGYIELPSAMSVLDDFTLYATPIFYYAVFGVWLMLMIVSSIIARLHYVKIEHNEVVVYGGVMESQKRMSTFRMHWTKEIKDVFEYWLPFVRSGTLIFTFPNEEKPLILNNVMGINRVLKKLDNKSGSFQVKGME